MISPIANYSRINFVNPQYDEEQRLERIEIKFSGGNKETWDQIENKIGEIGHMLYNIYGEDFIQIGRLIHTDCVGINW